MAESPAEFGALLRERRLKRGYSLRKFAELIEVSPTYLSLIETGKATSRPTADRVRRMAEVLGEDPDAWIAMAGRIADDVKKIILEQPEQIPELLRTVSGLSAEQVRELIDQVKRKRQEDEPS